MWPEYGYNPFSKSKKNNTWKREKAKGCFGSKRNDLKLLQPSKAGYYK